MRFVVVIYCWRGKEIVGTMITGNYTSILPLRKLRKLLDIQLLEIVAVKYILRTGRFDPFVFRQVLHVPPLIFLELVYNRAQMI